MFDPEADKILYCNEYDEGFNNAIVGAVVVETEPSYEEDNYNCVDHKDLIFETIHIWGVVEVLCLTRRCN